MLGGQKFMYNHKIAKSNQYSQDGRKKQIILTSLKQHNHYTLNLVIVGCAET